MKDSRITFRLTEEEKEKLNALAAERGITVSQLIREICEEIFQQKRK